MISYFTFLSLIINYFDKYGEIKYGLLDCDAHIPCIFRVNCL